MARTHTPHFLRGRHRKTVPATTATTPTATVAAPPVPTTAPAPDAPAPAAGAPAPAGAVTATPAPAATPATRATPEAFHYDDRARLASYRRTAPRPPAGQAGAWLVLLVTLTVLYAQWALFPQNARAQSDANWALGFAIISMGGALRILVGNPGRHLVSVAAILVSGVGLVLRAFLVTGGVDSWVLVYEGVCGALLLLGGLMVLRSPVLEPDPPATDPWG